MVKKGFLQSRLAPVPGDAEPDARAEDARYARQRRRGFYGLRFEEGLENEYRRVAGPRWVRATFAAALLGLTLFVALAAPDWSANWLALGATVPLGWLALYLHAWQSRRDFLFYGELRQQALIDGLTSAMNRRAFHQHLDLIWRQAEREGVAIGLMLLDIDHFKQINDRHGHQAGDRVLHGAAQILKTYALRPLDAVGRYGGDEFIVAWYGAEAEAFKAVIQLLPAKLWMGLSAADLRQTDITVSGGAVLVWPSAEVSMDRAILAVDQELYRVKRHRRGIIGLAPPFKGSMAQPDSLTAETG